MSAEGTANATANAAKDALKEVAEVFGDILAPVIGFGVGVFLGINNVIGGPWTLAKAFAQLPSWGPSISQCNWIGGGVFALAYGGAALACWHADGAEGSIRRPVMRTLAGLFGGLSLGSVIWAATGAQTQGFFDQLGAEIQAQVP